MCITVCTSIFLLAQIKRLLRERTDLDKRLQQRDEEVSRLEGRLQQAVKDRTSLQANLASAEKEVKDTKKANDLLKQKVQPIYTFGGFCFFLYFCSL